METPTKTRQLVLNKVRCKLCGEELISYHHHDYKTCSCDNQTMVDGGLNYLRYGGFDMNQVELAAVYLDEPFEIVRNAFHWGTYGKSGKENLKYVLLSSMSNPHLLKITSLMTGRIPSWIEELFTKELEYRRQNKIWVKDKPINE